MKECGAINIKSSYGFQVCKYLKKPTTSQVFFKCFSEISRTSTLLNTFNGCFFLCFAPMFTTVLPSCDVYKASSKQSPIRSTAHCCCHTSNERTSKGSCYDDLIMLKASFLVGKVNIILLKAFLLRC